MSSYHNRCTHDGLYFWRDVEVATIKKVDKHRKQRWVMTPHNKTKHGQPIAAETRHRATFTFAKRMAAIERAEQDLERAKAVGADETTTAFQYKGSDGKRTHH